VVKTLEASAVFGWINRTKKRRKRDVETGDGGDA
jgi:hypothetical protein